MKKILLIVAVTSFLSGLQAQNAPLEWKVQTNRTVSDINPDMYGIFFEDINFGADGGLYAELIKNRSFEFPQNLMGWKTFGKVELRTIEAPFERNPHYVRLSPSGMPTNIPDSKTKVFVDRIERRQHLSFFGMGQIDRRERSDHTR
jgi:hypothetical protein